MVDAVPFIPDSAPFTPEQRAYLNGLLAGIFSSAPRPGQEVAKPSLRIAVLYASQSGTAEGLARKLAKELKAQGHVPAVSTLVGYTPAALATEKYAVLLASTYGEGDAPDGVQPFYEQLCLEHFPRLENLSYAVFALGDKHYEHFCKFGCDLDTKLAALGANPICSRVECDVDLDEPFQQWKAMLLPRLNEIASARAAAAHASASNAPASGADASKPKREALSGPAVMTASLASTSTSQSPSRENPALAPLVDKRNLAHGDSSKETLHLAFSMLTLFRNVPYQAQ